MLGAITSVTFSASDIDMSERLYSRYLGYATVSRGTVSDRLARSWSAPKAASARQLVMQPASGEAMYLRFVEGGADKAYKPLTTSGWNAAEFIVEDVHALNDRLVGSPFRIIGKPAPLKLGGGSDVIFAMQVLGPDDETLYLTHVTAPVPGFDLPSAKSFVDRVFITVMGGPSLATMTDFFAAAFALPKGPAMAGIVGVLNRALALPDDHKTTLASVVLPWQCLIEIDEMPAHVGARGCRPGHLPPGIAMTSFAHDDLAAVQAPFLAPPTAHDEAPYFGARAATVVGGAGELIELIEIDG